MTKDVIVDLETGSTHMNAKLLGIGAVALAQGDMSHLTSELPKELALVNNYCNPYMFHSIVKRGSCTGHVSTESKKFWLEQPQELRDLYWDHGNVTLTTMLENFSLWFQALGDPKDIRIWGNGCNFDIAILEGWYNFIGEEVPWKYNKVHNVRTVKETLELLNNSPYNYRPFLGTKHHALYDAYNEAWLIKDWLDYLDFLSPIEVS